MRAITLLLSIILQLANNIRAEESLGNKKLCEAAVSIINPNVIYDPAYVKLAYPNGDVASNRGVCTDVVIRAYRIIGIDLQKEVHEDMKANFTKYKSAKWKLTSTDKNIDHRRVPNLQVFFSRKGTTLPITDNPRDYKPGDIVTWDLGNGLVHIGIVIDRFSRISTPLIVHNIGQGQIAEDILFRFKITGHYRY